MVDDPYDMDLRLCDDAGLVSFEEVKDDITSVSMSYMDRHLHLQGMTQRGREFLKAHPNLGDEPFYCTGHAHLAGLHIHCTSPWHELKSRRLAESLRVLV